MAAMTHAITFRNQEGSNRVYTVDAYHSIATPFLISQTRKSPDPSRGQVVQEDSFSLYAVTTDAAGAVLAQKEGVSIGIKRPITGNATTRANLLALLLDFMNSDEFVAAWSDSDNIA